MHEGTKLHEDSFYDKITDYKNSASKVLNDANPY